MDSDEEKYAKAAEKIANLVEDCAWDFLSVEDEAKAIAIIRELVESMKAS